MAFKKPAPKPERTIDSGIEDAIRAIKTKFGDEAIMKLGEKPKVGIDAISTGSIGLDMALGIGGLPRGRIVEIFGPEASGKCISRDSMVFSEFGMLPIGSFGYLSIPGFQKKEALVYSEHSLEKTSHFYNDGLKKTVRVETSQGFTIEGTPSHRVRVLDQEGNYLFRRLSEIKKEDHVAIQRGQNFFGQGVPLSEFVYQRKKSDYSSKPFHAPSVLTREVALLMGYLVGDGTTTRTGLNENNIKITAADREVKDDVNAICRKLFHEIPRVTKDKRTKNTVQLSVHNSHARAFLAYAGLGWHTAGEKEVPWSVLCSPKKIVSAFLSALFECDGCFSGATIEYCTKSKKLAEQLHIILLNFGVTAKKKIRVVSGQDYYYLYIEGQRDKKKFLEEIGFRSKRKNNKLKNWISHKKKSKTNIDVIPHLGKFLDNFLRLFGEKIRKTNRKDWRVIGDYLPKPRGKGCGLSYDRLDKIIRHFSEGRNLPEYQRLEQLQELGFFFDPVKNIKKTECHVVDFTIPKTATFFANGFVNHNTTLALHAIAEAQKTGGICAFIDAEHAMDPDYAKKLGVNINELLLSQPDNGEQALEITEGLVRSGKIDVIVIDSVAALTPKDEIEGDMGAHQVGKQARLMSQALRKLTAIAAKSKTIIIFINQIRMQIGISFGNPETTTGGKALKFYTSVRLDIRRIASIKKGEEVVGSRSRVKVVKNKVAAPFKSTEFDIIYGEGIAREGEIIALGEKLGLISKSGASYSMGETKLGRGYDATRTFLKENPKIANDLLKDIKKKLAEV